MNKNEMEKIAKMGDPKKDNKNKLANEIVDKNYERNKNNYPLTQSAEIAKDLLSFKVKDGHIENEDGRRITNAKEAIELNEALNKNFNDHKTDNYLKKISPTLFQDTLPKNKIEMVKENPTVIRYKQFRENKEKEVEDKKFNEDFEKEYSDQTTKNYVRAKVNKNKRAGKREYDNLSINDIIINEDTKDKAKAQLKLIDKNPVQSTLPNTDIVDANALGYRPTQPPLDTYMNSVAPTRDPDLDAGIAGLDEIKRFKNTMDLADQKFPTKARGIGPFISGEDDAT